MPNMKKIMKIFLLALPIMIANVNADSIIINRTKINGNGTGLYNDISRDETSGVSATGQKWVQVDIGCANPGDNTCPTSKPIGGGWVMETVDPSVANYVENRMLEIEQDIASGNTTNHNSFIVQITMSNGSIMYFSVIENWDCDEYGNGEVTLSLSDISI